MTRTQMDGPTGFFRRERLSSSLIEEYGTMVVDTIYKVESVKPYEHLLGLDGSLCKSKTNK